MTKERTLVLPTCKVRDDKVVPRPPSQGSHLFIAGARVGNCYSTQGRLGNKIVSQDLFFPGLLLNLTLEHAFSEPRNFSASPWGGLARRCHLLSPSGCPRWISSRHHGIPYLVIFQAVGDCWVPRPSRRLSGPLWLFREEGNGLESQWHETSL